MAQLPTQPWEADRESNAPDCLGNKWESIKQDIDSTFSNISNIVNNMNLAKESSGLAISNIESSAASAQQNDKEMFLLLQGARDILCEMELRFRDMQNKPFIITKKDVNNTTIARQNLDKVLSISCYKVFIKTDF